MQDMIGKKVEVSTAEITYNGILVEVGEKEIYLISDNGWIVIPVDGVAEIKAVE